MRQGTLAVVRIAPVLYLGGKERGRESGGHSAAFSILGLRLYQSFFNPLVKIALPIPNQLFTRFEMTGGLDPERAIAGAPLH